MNAFDAAKLANAIALVKASGYNVSKPRTRKAKKEMRVGPTCVAIFADGTQTRMTTYCPGDVLDWGRGERLSQHAWGSRHKTTAENAPPISSIRFERDGAVLGERTNMRAGDKLAAWMAQALAA